MVCHVEIEGASTWCLEHRGEDGSASPLPTIDEQLMYINVVCAVIVGGNGEDGDGTVGSP